MLNTHIKQIAISFALLLTVFTTLSAQKLSGIVTNQHAEPLAGVTVFWMAEQSIGTVTNDSGRFVIPFPANDTTRRLVARYVGYASMQIKIAPHESAITIVMMESSVLSTVVIEASADHTYSSMNARNTEVIGEQDLRLAPCCNLAESFETSGAVDVSYADPVTGIREIEMLGLRGIYAQMMQENRPALYGLAAGYGLEFIPGAWIDNIAVSKGTSTVINGPKAITGQINYELKKADQNLPLSVSLFANHTGRFEANGQWGHHFNKELSTALLLHFDATPLIDNGKDVFLDMNEDGFLDNNKHKQYNGLWRWSYRNSKIVSHLDIQALRDEHTGGQLEKLKDAYSPLDSLYRTYTHTDRVEASFKLGYIGFQAPYKALGFQLNTLYHNLGGDFGHRLYSGQQKSLYANLMYETIIGNTFHKLRMGSSYQLDNYQEAFEAHPLNRTEHLPGVYAEYTWDIFTKTSQPHTLPVKADAAPMSLSLGMRTDWLNSYGLIPTPRLNFKWNIDPRNTFRVSAGRGFRTAAVLAENMTYMATAKQFVYPASSISPEIAWNYGVNFLHKFYVDGQEGSVNIDFYRTDFTRQLVVDLDANPSQVQFTNLKGRSFSNSLIVMYSQEVSKSVKVKLGYKYNGAQMTTGGVLQQKILLPEHRALATVTYRSPNHKWEFSGIAQFIGSQRLPAVVGSLASVPQYRIDRQTPAFSLWNTQLTYIITPGFDVYGGVENIFGYQQKDPIIGAADPFHLSSNAPMFDASMVYAPMGRMFYAGVRMRLDGTLSMKSVEIMTSAKCEMCKEKIEPALLSLPGVKAAELDLSTKRVMVKYNAQQVSPQQIKVRISATGYDADDLPRNKEAYEKLPACCK